MSKLSKSVKTFRLKQLALYGGIVGVVAAITVPIAVVISNAVRPPRETLFQPSRVLLNEETVFSGGVTETEAWIPEVIDGKQTGDFVYNPKFKELFASTPMGVKVNKTTWKVSKEKAHTKSFSKVWNVNGLRLFQISKNHKRNLVESPKPTYVSKKDGKTHVNPYSDDYVTDNIAKGWTFKQLMDEVSSQINQSPHSYVINRGSYALVEPTIVGNYTSYGDSSTTGSGLGTYRAVALTDVFTSYAQVLVNFMNDNFRYVDNSSSTKNTLVAETLFSSEHTIDQLQAKKPRNIMAFFSSKAYKKALTMNVTPNSNDQSKVVTFSEYLKQATIQNLKWNIIHQSIDTAVQRSFPLLNTQKQAKKLEGTKFIKSISDLYDGFSGVVTDTIGGTSVALLKSSNLKTKIKDLLSIKSDSKVIAHDINSFDKSDWGNILGDPIGYKKVFDGNKYVDSKEAISIVRARGQGFSGARMLYKFRGTWDRQFIKNTLSGLELGVENYGAEGDKFKVDVVNNNNEPDKLNSFKEAVHLVSTSNDPEQLKAWFSGPHEMSPDQLTGASTEPSFDASGLINGYTIQIPIKFYLGTLFNKMNGKTEADNKNIMEQLAYKLYSPLRFNTNKSFVNDPSAKPTVKNKNVFTLLTKNNISKILDKVNSEIFTSGYSGTIKTSVFGNAELHNFSAHQRKFYDYISDSQHKGENGRFSGKVSDEFNNKDYIKTARWNDKGILEQDANNTNYILNSTSHSPIARSFSEKLTDLMTIGMFYNEKPENYFYAQKFQKTLNNYLISGFDLLKQNGTGFTAKLAEVVVGVQEYLNRESFDASIGGMVTNDITRDSFGKTLIFHSLKNIKNIKIMGKNVKVFEVPTSYFATTDFSGVNKKLNGTNPAMRTFATEPVSFGTSSISTVKTDDSINQTFEIEVFDDNDQKITFSNVSGRPGTGLSHEDSFAESQFFLKQENGKLYSITFKNTKGIYYA